MVAMMSIDWLNSCRRNVLGFFSMGRNRRAVSASGYLSVIFWLLSSWSLDCSSLGSDLLVDGQLRVISYNVQFLPGIAALANKRPDPEYRAVTIGKLMADYDIVGLNELFDDKPKELLLAEIMQAWGDRANIILSPKVQPDRFTGGLAILSRLPFLETNVHTYTQSSSPKKYGIIADGFATKGILHARIALSPQASTQSAIDVFVTHMEALDSTIRPSQYAEFAQFVRQHGSASRPAILMGDFNTRGGAAEMSDKGSAYHLMFKEFAASRPESQLQDLWPMLEPGPGGTSDQIREDGGSRIDYIFLLNPQVPFARLKPQSVAVNRFLDQRVVALSDHSAVEAELKWIASTNGN
jgi:endonuclease/exonuclease/phosphatase family metal-dependent hydrolase